MDSISESKFQEDSIFLGLHESVTTPAEKKHPLGISEDTFIEIDVICATHGVTKIETVGAMAFYKTIPWMVDFLTGDSFVENGHKLD